MTLSSSFEETLFTTCSYLVACLCSLLTIHSNLLEFMKQYGRNPLTANLLSRFGSGSDRGLGMLFKSQTKKNPNRTFQKVKCCLAQIQIKIISSRLEGSIREQSVRQGGRPKSGSEILTSKFYADMTEIEARIFRGA